VVEAVSARRSVIKKDELKPGTKYSVYVKATTVKGDGVGSDPVILQTPSKGMHVELDLISRECTHFWYQCFSLEQILMLLNLSSLLFCQGLSGLIKYVLKATFSTRKQFKIVFHPY